MTNAGPKQAAAQLREILALLSTAVEKVARKWEGAPDGDDAHSSEPRDYVNAQSSYDPTKTALAALGSIESLITDPYRLLINMSTSYLVSRALHIVADHDIAAVLARTGDDRGVHVTELAKVTGLDKGKLCRIMRALTSHHIFQEVEEDTFANNHISKVLAGDPAFRAHIMMKGRVHYTASDHLPAVLSDAQSRSYDPQKTAFQQAVGTGLSIFDWMNKEVPADDTDWRAGTMSQSSVPQPSPSADGLNDAAIVKMVPRPEKKLFHQAMAGLDRGSGHFYLHDYPWWELGGGTVVDVGGGIGSFCMELHERYPDLHLVVQDRTPVIQQAISTWEAKFPKALPEGKVELMPHDFFKPNPVLHADVYWLRYIAHDWPDAKVQEILNNVACSMTPSSRLLIADVVVVTTLGCPEIASAPAPLLANYGKASAYAHMMDMNMMAMVDGRERTPNEFSKLVEGSRLEIVRIWQGRGADTLGIVECRLAYERSVR
ncbi:putative O-methyltransferase domain-containing protein [Seiridium unicorne]|uniref:O-methyltransferase domain-containing protein n=1 Tax=Seiridium unicorne TaxID=138068 RepID=A0ABR2UJ21_9PEZI